jgi:hypothetical protein
MNEGALGQLVAKDAIREQVYRYCRAIDRMDRALVRTIWHPNGTVDFGDGSIDPDYTPGPPPVPYEVHFAFAWRWRAKLLAHSHQATNVLIEIDGDRANSETTSIANLQKLKDGQVEQTLIWGRWVDRWSLRHGRWAIDHRVGLLDCACVSRFRAGPLNDPAKRAARRNREDPSYAFLVDSGIR